jgi:hypothetical protein
MARRVLLVEDDDDPVETRQRAGLVLAVLALLPVVMPAQITDRMIELHAPVLERRANAVGTESDVPLLMYAERIKDEAGPYVQYSVIFSNEDGGTSTRALMARWGRTTDIEHVYRVWFDEKGRRLKATIQTKDHKDVEFKGPFEEDRPLLRVITDNNMVGPGGSGTPRVRLRPVIVDLSGCSREKMMDDNAQFYRIAAEELKREGKLPLLGDMRQYLYLEAEVGNLGTRLAARVRLRGGDRWYSSHAGRFDWAIERSGFIRTTIQLPAHTKPDQLAEIGIECLAEKDVKAEGGCRVVQVTKAFFLDESYRPGRSLWKKTMNLTIRPGEMATWTLTSR